MIWEQIVKNFELRAPERKRAEAVATHKTCTNCKELLPLSSFYYRGDGYRRMSRCKKCCVAYSSAQQKIRRAERKLPVANFTFPEDV